MIKTGNQMDGMGNHGESLTPLNYTQTQSFEEPNPLSIHRDLIQGVNVGIGD